MHPESHPSKSLFHFLNLSPSLSGLPLLTPTTDAFLFPDGTPTMFAAISTVSTVDAASLNAGNTTCPHSVERSRFGWHSSIRTQTVESMKAFTIFVAKFAAPPGPY